MAGALARREIVGAHVPVLAMSKGFGKGYTPMTESEVRSLAVSGDNLSYLRERREILRSMTPEQAFSVMEFHKNLNVFQALELAKTQNKLIVPNDVMDRILTETDKTYDGWTGTMAIYEATNKPFGDKVVYNWKDAPMQHTVSFDVPQQFRGQTNCALVVVYPDFEFISLGDNRFEIKTAEGTVSLLEHFPKSNGWYSYDEGFRIPVGRPKKANKSNRYLWRYCGGYVGLVARGCYNNGYDGDRRNVGLNNEPSSGFEVALF